MTGQKQDKQLEHTYSSYVKIRGVALKTSQTRWTIGRSRRRGSGISVPVARHYDANDDLSECEFNSVTRVRTRLLRSCIPARKPQRHGESSANAIKPNLSDIFYCKKLLYVDPAESKFHCFTRVNVWRILAIIVLIKVNDIIPFSYDL